MANLIQAKKVNKIFKDAAARVEALRDIDLSIDEGEYIAIVGPSGAGKSTLIHILSGLDYPSSGKVLFEGKDIFSLRRPDYFRLRNKKIGFMFQFYYLISELTVAENVQLPCLLDPKSRKSSRDKAEKLCRRLGIETRLDFYPAHLSGGEQQRVSLARALINEPKVLFCDEPTGNLDHKASDEVRFLLQDLNKNKGMAVVLVTHNLELAKDAQRVLNIKDGILN